MDQLFKVVHRTLHTADNEPKLMIPGPVMATDRVKQQASMPPINHVGELCLKTFSALVPNAFFRM